MNIKISTTCTLLSKQIFNKIMKDQQTLVKNILNEEKIDINIKLDKLIPKNATFEIVNIFSTSDYKFSIFSNEDDCWTQKSFSFDQMKTIFNFIAAIDNVKSIILKESHRKKTLIKYVFEKCFELKNIEKVWIDKYSIFDHESLTIPENNHMKSLKITSGGINKLFVGKNSIEELSFDHEPDHREWIAIKIFPMPGNKEKILFPRLKTLSIKAIENEEDIFPCIDLSKIEKLSIGLKTYIEKKPSDRLFKIFEMENLVNLSIVFTQLFTEVDLLKNYDHFFHDIKKKYPKKKNYVSFIFNYPLENVTLGNK